MKLHQLPIIGFLLINLDRDIKERGLQKAMLNIVKRSETKLIIKGKSKNTEDILKNKPVVVVANHPYESEVVALIASLPSRDDAYLIVNSHFIGVSPHLDRHLIPVYIWHHVTDGKPKKFFGRLLHTLHPTPIYNPTEEHKRNIDSIQTAINKVKDGGLVIIFPGRRGKEGKWFPGVGHLVRGIGKDAYIVKAFIEGTADRDYLRMIPGLGKWLPSIKVHFAPPTDIRSLTLKDGKQITATLEQEYNKWVHSFQAPTLG